MVKSIHAMDVSTSARLVAVPVARVVVSIKPRLYTIGGKTIWTQSTKVEVTQ